LRSAAGADILIELGNEEIGLIELEVSGGAPDNGEAV
jgi:hypothetical protein